MKEKIEVLDYAKEILQATKKRRAINYKNR